jgi:uncharacterized protein YjlB
MSINRVEPSTYFFKSDGHSVPNNPSLPVLVYSQIFNAETDSLADRFEDAFTRNEWSGCWRWGVYDFQHFHCNAHEALGIAQGQAEIQLGGPDGDSFQVKAGDLIVLPAGTGHRNLGCTNDFFVVGAYPSGQGRYETNRGDPSEFLEAIRRIAETPPPTTDPIYGRNGPLIEHWGNET